MGVPVLAFILIIGMLGYHFLEKTNWIESYANAAMIISGVGVFTNPVTEKGIVFVATYSILGGATFLIVVAVVFAPIFHWLFRKMKVEDREHFKD